MNQVAGPLSSASQCLSILTGGRSPNYWRQKMSQRIAPLSAMQRNSGWVGELATIDLRLSDSPLLGETLSALMSRNTVTGAAPAEVGVTRKPSSESTPTRKRELKMPRDLNSNNSARVLERQVPEAKRATPAPVTPGTSEPTEAVLQLPPQADASFLRRIAGDISELARDRSDLASETVSARVKRLSDRPTEVGHHSKQQHEQQTLTPAGKSRFRSAVAQEPAPVARVDQVELAKCVQRVARRIEAAFQRRSLLTHDLFTAAAVTRDRVLPADLQSLTEHWSMPINGPTASADLLLRLASSASLRSRRSHTELEREPAWTNSLSNEPSPVVAEALPKHPRPAGSSSTVHQPRNSEHSHPFVPFNSHVPQPWSNQVDAAADNLASGIQPESPPAETSDAERWSGLVPTSAQPVSLLSPATAPAIAPPSLTPSLPPLHSQKRDDVVLPIAAATAQRQARYEEAIAHGEDLTLLAERMERILKQEARRHGIDV